MDGHRFDRITRALAGGTTRRGVIAGLGALLVGVRAAAGQVVCPPGQTANRRGECRCPAGTDPCPDGCFDLKRDSNNCGTCGTICYSENICQKGKCYCPPGFVQFGGWCSPSDSTGLVLEGPAAAVWHALTDGETLTSLGIASTIAPRVGHRFQIRPAQGARTAEPIEAEMILVDAPRLFAFNWLNGPLDEPTTVTITLDSEADDTVTRFRLAHTDPSGASCRAGALVLGRSWGPRLFKETLPRHLASMR